MHRVTHYRRTGEGIEAISLESDRAFPRHAHDEFGVGVIVSGAHRSWSGRGQVDALAGDAIMVNRARCTTARRSRPARAGTGGMQHLHPRWSRAWRRKKASAASSWRIRRCATGGSRLLSASCMHVSSQENPSRSPATKRL